MELIAFHKRELQFSQIGAKSKTILENGKTVGIDALGILKADVDDLGRLMLCGLPAGQLSISRLASMSRQLDQFFSLYLPYLLSHREEFNSIYTVFSGGDDLFLIGPWNQIVTLASELSDKFRAFSCNNPDIHLSAGISLHKPHTPVDYLSETTENLLKKSKNQDGKDSVTLFGVTVKWSRLENLRKIETTLSDWLENHIINNAMLYRLNGIIDLAEEEKSLVKENPIILDKLSCTKWRAYLSYSVGRNVATEYKSTDERESYIDEVGGKLAGWLEKYGAELKIPLWTLLYNQR